MDCYIASKGNDGTRLMIPPLVQWSSDEVNSDSLAP